MKLLESIYSIASLWIASGGCPRKDEREKLLRSLAKTVKVESSLRDLTLGLAWRALRSDSFILANLFYRWILRNRWNL